MKTNKFASLLALFFLFAVTACDDDNDNDNDLPTPDMANFSVSISGDMDYTAEGQSFFTTYFEPEYDDDIFIINMIEGIASSFNLFFIKSGDQPGTGSYPVNNYDFAEDGELPLDAFVSAITIQLGDDETPDIYFLEAQDGFINFEESSTNRVRGSFEYVATGFHGQEPDTELQAEVSGDFNAMYAEPGGPDL